MLRSERRTRNQLLPFGISGPVVHMAANAVRLRLDLLDLSPGEFLSFEFALDKPQCIENGVRNNNQFQLRQSTSEFLLRRRDSRLGRDHGILWHTEFFRLVDDREPALMTATDGWTGT